MTNKLLGSMVCTVCGGDVELRESKKEKSYYACGDCNVQVFSRGSKSDQLLRKKIVTPQVEEVAKVSDVVAVEKNESNKSGGGLIGWFNTDD